MKYKVGDKVKVKATDLEFFELSIGYDGTMNRLREEVSEISKEMPNAKIGNGITENAYVLNNGFIIPEKYLIIS